MAVRRKKGNLSPMLLGFGRQLRRYREAAELSQESLGRRANNGRGVTGQYVGQVESGRTRCTREFAATMDRELGAGGRLLELWDDLVLDAAFPTWFDWPSVEAEAVHITAYCLSVIDGLFQTRAYASAILRGNKEAVEARLKRQGILTRDDPPPPSYSLLLDEATLVREVGDAEVMREQMEHLLLMAEQLAGRLTIQVIPARGEHEGNSEAFAVATLDDRSEIAYVESAARGMTMSDSEDLVRLSSSLMELRGLALPVSMSLDAIRRTAETKWTT